MSNELKNIHSISDICNMNIGLGPYNKQVDRVESGAEVIDEDWVSSKFMVGLNELEGVYKTNAYWSTANFKFVDTTLGGHIAINPRPQFTRYADVRAGNRIYTNPDSLSIETRSLGIGIGRYYSEAIDDNTETVYLQFGVPKFNSLVNFFTRAISYEDAYIATHGRYPVGYNIGKVVGGLFMLAAFPLMTLTIWGIKTITKAAIGESSFDYYYMEPTMHMYWSSVNSIVTQMASELGVLIPEFMPSEDKAAKIGIPLQVNQEDLEGMKELFRQTGDDGIISKNNYIDVFAVATRAQAIANEQLWLEREYYKNGTITELNFEGYAVDTNTKAVQKVRGGTFADGVNKALSFQAFLDKLTKGDGLFADPEEEKIIDDTTSKVGKDQLGSNNAGIPAGAITKDSNGYYSIDESYRESGWLDKSARALDSTLRDGGAFAIFNVNYTGSISDSFSNSTGTIETGDTIKSVASGSRNLKFSVAGGNLAANVDEIVKGVGGVIAGALDSVTYGLSNVLTTLTGGAFVDIPKRWDDSEVSLGSVNYSIDLISPYGHPISQLQNIYIPLAMLLAGALPLKAGESSYASPFLCSIFNKGKQNIKLGMITSLSVERGTSNLAFNRQKRPLAFKVSFTVTDFSNIMSAPINSSMFDIFKTSLNDSSLFGRYIASLTSRDIITDKYLVPKLKLRASRLLMAKDQMLSPYSWGMRSGESIFSFMSAVLHDQSVALNQMNGKQ